MFSFPARPFFQSSSVLSLKPISMIAYSSFIISHFQKARKQISAEAIQYLYEKFDGTTWYIQKICNELYASVEDGHICDISDVDEAIDYAVEEKSDTYQDLIARLPAKQKALLIALAHSGKDVRPTGTPFIRKYYLGSPSAVQRSMVGLMHKDIVSNHNGQYYIYDDFLTMWLKKK